MHDPQDKAKRHMRESILREKYSHSPEARRRGEQSEAGHREDAQDGRIKFSWSASPRGPAANLRERDTRREARNEPHGFLHRDLDDGEATAMLVARITEMRDELGRLMRDNAAHEQSALDAAAVRCADDRPYTTQDGNTATYHFSADAARILPPALSPASRRHHYTHPGAHGADDGASPGARRRHAAHEPELYDEKWWPRKELGEPVSDLSVASGPARPRHWSDRDVALVEEIDFLHAKIRREREKKAKRNTALLSRNPSSPGQGGAHPQLLDPSVHSGEYYYDAGRNLKYKPTSQDLQSAGWDMEAAPVEIALPLSLFVALYRPHGWEGADESLYRTLEKEGERGGLTRFTLCLAHDLASVFQVASDRVRVERVSALRGREERDVLTAKVYLLTSVLQVDAVERRVVDVFNRHKKLPLRKASRVFDEETGVPAQCVLKTYRSKIGTAFAPDELEGYSGAFSPFPRTTTRNASASPQRENSDSGSDAVSSTGSVTSASATSASGDSRRRRRSSRSRRRRRDGSDGGSRSPSHSRSRRRRRRDDSDASQSHSPHAPAQSSRRRSSRSRRRRAASEEPDTGSARHSPYAPVAEPLYSAPAAASETETGSSTFPPFAPSAPTPTTSTRRSSSRRRRGGSRSRRGGSRRGSSRGSSASSTGTESVGSSRSRRSRSRRSQSRRGGDGGSSSPYPQQPSFKAPPSEASPSRRSSRRRRRSDSSERSASPARSHRPSRRSVAAPLPQPPLHKSAPAQPYPQSYAKLPPRGGEASADDQAVPLMPAAQPPPLLTSDDDGRTRRRRRRDAGTGDEDAGNGKRERRRRRRSEQESEAAAVGSTVEVHSLVQSYELNGRRGTVTGVRLLSDGDEALAVAMDDGGEEQMLRRQNVRVVGGGGSGDGGGDGGRTRRRRRRSPSASSRTEPVSPSRRGSSDVAKSPGPPPGAPRVKSLFVKEAPPPGSQPAAYPQRQPSLAQTPERQNEPSVGFARGPSASTRRGSNSPALSGSAKRMS